MYLKANTPAGIAEEFLINSIWNNQFPPGSILPSERELAELIGVTRTTLREVLQRLARDGWLKIRHGKPTMVNNIWETSSLNILDTIAKIEKKFLPQLAGNLLAAKQTLAPIFIRRAFRRAPEDVDDVLSIADEIEDSANNYAEFDFTVFQRLAFASGNLIYGLMLNGLKGLYLNVSLGYFSNPKARVSALNFYHQLRALGKQKAYKQITLCVNQYSTETHRIWLSMKSS